MFLLALLQGRKLALIRNDQGRKLALIRNDQGRRLVLLAPVVL